MYATDDLSQYKEQHGIETDNSIVSWLERPLNYFWNKCSMELLSSAEEKLLSASNITYSVCHIPLRDACRTIWTLSSEPDPLAKNVSNRLNRSLFPKDAVPIVLLHGLGGGLGLWVLNLWSLSRHRKVYAMDLLGFGKSTRCHFR